MIKLIKSTFYREKNTKEKLCSFIRHSKMLSFGPECQKFEENFAKWQKRKYCVFVNSGSSANLALIQSLLNLGKLKKGNYVGFSALTWSTNVMPLIELGLSPVPIDIELDTLNISSRKVIEVLKKYPLKMIFVTNLLGFCDDIDEIRKICNNRKILLIEDNCEALGTRYKNQLLGNIGKASTFSFYVGHTMSTIEGGAVCTDSESLATMLRLVRAHGWDRNLSEKRQEKIRIKHKVNSTFYSRYTFYDLGYNLRPTEINGFLGNEQLQYLNEIIDKRKNNFLAMAVPIYSRSNMYYPIRYDHIDLLSNFAIPIICKTKKIRDDVVKRCNGKVEIRPIVGGDIAQQPFYSKYAKKLKINNPNAILAHQQGLYFGNNPELSAKEIKDLINIFTT